jgi:uncharacterized protein DUF6894
VLSGWIDSYRGLDGSLGIWALSIGILKQGRCAVPRYFFTIRWPHHEDIDRLGTSLPDDAAALNHAICIIRELRQGGEHDDPGLMMIVRNEMLKTVLSLPFLAGCA